ARERGEARRRPQHERARSGGFDIGRGSPHGSAMTLLPLLLAFSMEAAANAPKLPVEQYQLDNGLTVLLSEDHSLPLVAVEVLYLVGSSYERVGRTGFAHLFEHLMFQGS